MDDISSSIPAINLIASPALKLQGEALLPGDKSISHRALILGAIAEGTTRIEGFLEGEDCLRTLVILEELGVKIKRLATGVLEIEGVGQKGFKPPSKPLDCGNSGTTMRLLAGLLAAQPFSSTLIGDASLQNRPMRRIVTPLTLMGAKITGTERGEEIYAPLKIEGEPNLQGITYSLPIASAQVKSCLLLAGLFAKGPTKLTEPLATRDHTENMLAHFGCPLLQDANAITLLPKPLKAQTVSVPGDISSAAFFIAGASFSIGSHLYLKEVGINPNRIGFIHVLKEMGADIIFHQQKKLHNEWRADIEVKGRPLKAITLPPKWVASSIDEFPILFIAASSVEGQSEIRGVAELRHKESDRISVMAEGLTSLGIKIKEYLDGIVIQGAPLQGGRVKTRGDHRVAMAFLIASLNSKKEIFVEDCANIATSFPHFQSLANQLGLALRFA